MPPVEDAAADRDVERVERHRLDRDRRAAAATAADAELDRLGRGAQLDDVGGPHAATITRAARMSVSSAMVGTLFSSACSGRSGTCTNPPLACGRSASSTRIST